MLILSRKTDQAIKIGDDITIISEAVNEMNYASEHNGETAPEVSLEELL